MPHTMLDLDRLDFAKGEGFVTVVAQDAVSGAVLMVARADREALERTIATGEMHYHSRTRGLWRKGETSGNRQIVVALLSDCDGDVVLARVHAVGPACHTGADTCFGRLAEAGDVLAELDATIERRQAEARRAEARQAEARQAEAQGAPPEEQDALDISATRHPSDAPRTRTSPADPGARSKPSYTQRLLADRNLRLKKIGEEAAELIAACADADRARAVGEAADLLYHVLVALRAVGGGLGDVRQAVADRRQSPRA
jgi:phosphoribosyl-ATP pyrophosphohydrolase/phosphoribosyl-AMP cyclohydrolase